MWLSVWPCVSVWQSGVCQCACVWVGDNVRVCDCVSMCVCMIVCQCAWVWVCVNVRVCSDKKLLIPGHLSTTFGASVVRPTTKFVTRDMRVITIDAVSLKCQTRPLKMLDTDFSTQANLKGILRFRISRWSLSINGSTWIRVQWTMSVKKQLTLDSTLDGTKLITKKIFAPTFIGCSPWKHSTWDEHYYKALPQLDIVHLPLSSINIRNQARSIRSL